MRFDRGLHGERVGDFPERGLNGFLIIGSFDEFGGFDGLKFMISGSGCENGPDNLRRETPGLRTGCEQDFQGGAFGAALTRERDGREKGGPGGADIGIGSLELMFGFKNVRAALRSNRMADPPECRTGKSAD